MISTGLLKKICVLRKPTKRVATVVSRYQVTWKGNIEDVQVYSDNVTTCMGFPSFEGAPADLLIKASELQRPLTNLDIGGSLQNSRSVQKKSELLSNQKRSRFTKDM